LVVVEAGNAILDESVERGGNVLELLVARCLSPKESPRDIVERACDEVKLSSVYVLTLPYFGCLFEAQLEVQREPRHSITALKVSVHMKRDP